MATEHDRQPGRDGRVTVLLLLAALLLVVNSPPLWGHLSFQREGQGVCRQLQRQGEKHQLLPVSCQSPAENGAAEHNAPPVNPAYTPISFAPVPINSADRELLMTVRGVGPRLADNILAYRNDQGPLTGAGQLPKIPGIGPIKAATLAPFFSFSPLP